MFTGDLKDEDDVGAILRFAEIDMNALKGRARRNNTLLILKTIIANITYSNLKVEQREKEGKI
ncbi:MAG: hypothetical protein QW231_04960 [Candidatus Bathyarchaeia archaeon]